MAPQLDAAVVFAAEEDRQGSSSSSGGGAAAGQSYWDAPIESSLMGKSASTIDVSLLVSNNPQQRQQQHQEQQTSYWDAPTDPKLRNKTVSKIDMDTLEHHDPAGEDYWGDAPICDSLQGKTVSELSMNKLDKQHPDAPKKRFDLHHSASFFDWKVKEIKRTLSKLSLSNLMGGSHQTNIVHDSQGELDRTRGVARSPSQTTTTPVPMKDGDGGGGPPARITTKTHRLRDSWRKSFASLSTATLKSLDESGNGSSGHSGRSHGNSRHKKNKPRQLPLDASSGSNASQFSVGNEDNMF